MTFPLPSIVALLSCFCCFNCLYGILFAMAYCVSRRLAAPTTCAARRFRGFFRACERGQFAAPMLAARADPTARCVSAYSIYGSHRARIGTCRSLCSRSNVRLESQFARNISQDLYRFATIVTKTRMATSRPLLRGIIDGWIFQTDNEPSINVFFNYFILWKQKLFFPLQFIVRLVVPM